jgi:hypothetical protein
MQPPSCVYTIPYKTRTAIICGFGAILIAGGCRSDVWTGIAYPNRYDLLVYQRTGSYCSLEECRTGTHAYLRGLGKDAAKTDYECGKNCRDVITDTSPMVCEATGQ